MGQNPANQCYAAPRTQLRALAGVRQGKREQQLRQNQISPHFSSTIREQAAASEASRKVHLPDIIRLAKTRLQDLTRLSPRQEEEFLQRFKGSIHLTVEEETDFERKLSPGKARPPRHAYRQDNSICTYQRAEHISTVEPTKTKRYDKQYGATRPGPAGVRRD